MKAASVLITIALLAVSAFAQGLKSERPPCEIRSILNKVTGKSDYSIFIPGSGYYTKPTQNLTALLRELTSMQENKMCKIRSRECQMRGIGDANKDYHYDIFSLSDANNWFSTNSSMDFKVTLGHLEELKTARACTITARQCNMRIYQKGSKNIYAVIADNHDIDWLAVEADDSSGAMQNLMALREAGVCL